jgi:hypothetical protein
MKEGAALRHGCSAAPLLRSTVARPWRGLGRGEGSRDSARGKGRSVAGGPCLRPLTPEPRAVTPASSAPEVAQSESAGAAADVAPASFAAGTRPATPTSKAPVLLDPWTRGCVRQSEESRRRTEREGAAGVKRTLTSGPHSWLLVWSRRYRG